jgi:hypothetical protein
MTTGISILCFSPIMAKLIEYLTDWNSIGIVAIASLIAFVGGTIFIYGWRFSDWKTYSIDFKGMIIGILILIFSSVIGKIIEFFMNWDSLGSITIASLVAFVGGVCFMYRRCTNAS